MSMQMMQRGGRGQMGSMDGGATTADTPPPPPAGSSGGYLDWIFESGLANVLILHTHEIKLMAMFGYALLTGYKLYPKFPDVSAISYRFISLALACTGGGILVPIFINAVPVTLGDSYPMVIIASFLIHEYYPMIRDIIVASPILKVALITMYECNRAKVICTFIGAANKAIAPSEFTDFALFGPIFCGAIAGCGGAFMPMSKGVDPIKSSGLAQPMLSALIAAVCFHLFVNTSVSAGIKDAAHKAQLIMAIYFISYHVYVTYFAPGAAAHGHAAVAPAPVPVPPAKKENGDSTKKEEATKKPDAAKKPEPTKKTETTTTKTSTDKKKD